MLELLLLFRMQGNVVVDFALSLWTSMSILDAMYSLVLRVKACCSSSVKRYLQPIPFCGQKPPIPHSGDSEKLVMVDFLKMNLLMDMPYFSDSSSSSQSSRLSRVRLEGLTLVLRLYIASIRHRLLIK